MSFSSRAVLAGIAGVALASVAAALLTQHVFDMQPCPWCVLQRLIFVLIALVALAGLAALGLASLPFWLVPPLWPLIPVVIMGWLNQRVLRYDALAEHATAEEMRRIFASRRSTLYMLGVVLALLAYIPFVGFVAPVLFGLAFIHLLLGELQVRRQAPIEGEAVRL